MVKPCENFDIHKYRVLYLCEETFTKRILGLFFDLNYLSSISTTQAKVVEFVRSRITSEKFFPGSLQMRVNSSIKSL